MQAGYRTHKVVRKRSILLKRNNIIIPNITSGSSFYGMITYNKKGGRQYGKNIVTSENIK